MGTPWMRRNWPRELGLILGFAFTYWVADLALNRFAFSDGWTIVWPLNGVTVALMLKRPRSAWFTMLLGVELGTAIGECMDGNSIGMEVCQRCCSVIEILVCAIVLPPYAELQDWLRTPHIHARFLGALALGPGISGLLAATLFHATQGQAFFWAFNNWATADALGIAATMPLALACNSRQMRNAFSSPNRWKTLGLLLFAFAGAAVVFSVSRYPLLFLLYPLLLWVDSVLGFVGSAMAAVGVCLIAVYCTTKGLGPFGLWPSDLELPRDLALQLYFGFHLITRFPVSVMLMERRRLAQEGERLAEDLRRSNARLTTIASLDGLTAIANRRAFDERLDEEWGRAALAKTPLALCLLDLDYFKQFNDLYGHAKGDACLQAVAAMLSAQLSGPEDLAARYGGEEFVILLPNTSVDGARKVAERIRVAALGLGIVHLGNPWSTVSVSVGIASVIPATDDSKLGFIQLADAALYCAKREGRNRVETIESFETLKSANEHFGDTTKIRLKRLLKLG